MINEKPVIGIIGAGRLGTAVTRQALKGGYAVRIANSKGPQSLQLILSVLMPNAKADTVEEVIRQSDIILLAIPLNQYKSLTPALFKNKIVIDGMNYWPPTEGRIEEFENKERSSSEYIQQYLPKANVVKTLNHIAYNELEEHALPIASPNRRGMGIAGDDSNAKNKVAAFINNLGFDPVDIGELRMGKKIQPDTKLFNARFTADEIRKLV